jgi:hypothetical protein
MRKIGVEVKRLLICSVVLLSACGTIPIQPRMGMTFNELYKQVARTDCGWLEVVSGEGDIYVYHVALSNPGCNPNIFYYFKDDQLVKIDQGPLYEQR